MTTIDPITLGVIQAGLQQVCDEMDLTFSRSAFSPVIAEADDRSDGIYDADTGSLIAQGEGGLPIFVGTMQFSTATLIEFIREGRALPPEEGDIYIVNDPYLGGTHLMDVRFAMPFYYRGALFAWLSNTGHWPDIGGAVPGGFSANATAVEQEGLRLPPVKLVKHGTIIRTWGDAYGYALVATGRADAMVDPVVRRWDVAPMLTIFPEAGGLFCDLSGTVTAEGGDALAANPALAPQVLALVGRT